MKTSSLFQMHFYINLHFLNQNLMILQNISISSQNPALLYLCDFVPPDKSIDIENGPETFRCNGIRGVNNPHDALKCEGSYTCATCEATFCMYCGYDPRKDRKKDAEKYRQSYFNGKEAPLCMNCYKDDLFLPLTLSEKQLSMTSVTIEEMINFLKEKNMAVHDSIEAWEVQELYEIIMYTENIHETMADAVKYPLFASSAMDSPCSTFASKVLSNYALRDGARFLTDRAVFTPKRVLQVISLLSQLVKINTEKKIVHYDTPVTTVLPETLVDWATSSRIDSGHRLMQRCLRHTLDTKAHPIITKDIKFFESKEDERLGIILENKIPASMKNSTYDVKIAFTEKDVMCCECSCPVGGMKGCKVICVHNLPVIYQLTLLLYDGLSEHFLVELSSRWENDLEEYVKENDLFDEVHENVLTLMYAVGEKDDKIEEARLIQMKKEIDQYSHMILCQIRK